MKLNILYCALLLTSFYTIVTMDRENKIEIAMAMVNEEDKIVAEKVVVGIEKPLDEVETNRAKTFLATQAIHIMAKNIAEEVKKNDIKLCLKKPNQPSTQYNQNYTEQGIFLKTNSSSHLRLDTPWGEVQIYDYTAAPYLVALFQAFQARGLNIAFVGNEGESDQEVSFYSGFENQNREYFEEKIPKKDFDLYRGTSVFIITKYNNHPALVDQKKAIFFGGKIIAYQEKTIKPNNSYPSIYQVKQVGYMIPPEPKYAKKTKKSHEEQETYSALCLADWKERKSIFKQHQKLIETRHLYTVMPETIRIPGVVETVKDYTDLYTPRLPYLAFTAAP